MLSTGILKSWFYVLKRILLEMHHINILFAFLAIFSNFGFLEAHFCGQFKTTQFFWQKFKSTHSKAHFIKNLRHEALPPS